MKRFLATAMLALAAGCSSTGSQDSYGTIESVWPVRLAEDRPRDGIFAGAAIGGILGESLSSGSVAGTLLGVVGGGFAGNAIERNATRQDGQEIVVRLDSGGTLRIVQPGMRDFEAGPRVER